MLVAVDVHYGNASAVVAGVLFNRWTDSKPIEEITSIVDSIADYEPGSFYKRELPCILQLLQLIKPVTGVVIDGYVTLGKSRKDGLGMYLWKALGESVPIVGVAKSRFQDTPTDTEVVRGNSKNPLFVTSVGIDQSRAKALVLEMSGENRIPTLLKRVDSLCRQT